MSTLYNQKRPCSIQKIIQYNLKMELRLDINKISLMPIFINLIFFSKIKYDYLVMSTGIYTNFEAVIDLESALVFC